MDRFCVEERAENDYKPLSGKERGAMRQCNGSCMERRVYYTSEGAGQIQWWAGVLSVVWPVRIDERRVCKM